MLYRVYTAVRPVDQFAAKLMDVDSAMLKKAVCYKRVLMSHNVGPGPYIDLREWRSSDAL